MIDNAFDQELDCKGMNCPLHIQKTKILVDTMYDGQVLKMVSTDPGSINVMIAWTRRTGHEMLSHNEEGGIYTFYIQKT